MEKYAGQTEEHVTEMVDKLRIGDDFEEMLLERAMVAHQTDHMNALQDDRERTEQPQRWLWPNREEHSQNHRCDERSNARRSRNRAHNRQ